MIYSSWSITRSNSALRIPRRARIMQDSDRRSPIIARYPVTVGTWLDRFGTGQDYLGGSHSKRTLMTYPM